MFAKLKALRNQLNQRIVYRQMDRLDDRLLADIGVTRHDLRLIMAGRY